MIKELNILMEQKTYTQVNELVARYPQLFDCKINIERAIEVLTTVFENGQCLYVCGNGGSAADALHIVGELTKSFQLKRSLDTTFRENCSDGILVKKLQGALPAFALVENSAFFTAFLNDCEPGYVYAQQVYTYARNGDCVLGISTSGNSQNVIHAINAAKGRNAVTIGLTGASGGKLIELCDCCICVPEIETYKIQELHLPIYHAICLTLEEHFWGDNQ